MGFTVCSSMFPTHVVTSSFAKKILVSFDFSHFFRATLDCVHVYLSSPCERCELWLAKSEYGSPKVYAKMRLLYS